MITIYYLLAFAILFTISFAIVQHSLKQSIKTRVKRMIGFFNQLGRRDNMSFSNKEILKDVIIGIDENQNKLLIVWAEKKNYDWRIISLENVSYCNTLKVYRRINVASINGRRFDRHLSRIIMQIVLKDTGEKVEVPFYVFGKNNLFEANYLKQRAEYWGSIISGFIQERAEMRA